MFFYHDNSLNRENGVNSFLALIFSFDSLFFQAWDAEGITVEGCVLTCQGEKICKTCQTYGSTAYHGARYRVPFSQEFPHFKVSRISNPFH